MSAALSGSHLRPKQAEEMVEESVDDVPPFKTFESEPMGLKLIRFEAFDHRRGKIAIEHVDVCLIIEPKGPIVEIDRSCRHPDIINNHDFGMIQRGFVLVELDARLQ